MPLSELACLISHGVECVSQSKHRQAGGIGCDLQYLLHVTSRAYLIHTSRIRFKELWRHETPLDSIGLFLYDTLGAQFIQYQHIGSVSTGSKARAPNHLDSIRCIMFLKLTGRRQLEALSIRQSTPPVCTAAVIGRQGCIDESARDEWRQKLATKVTASDGGD